MYESPKENEIFLPGVIILTCNCVIVLPCCHLAEPTTSCNFS